MSATAARPSVAADFPEKMSNIFEPKRYKVYYGGRGGGKSWGVARHLVIRGARSPIRVLCIREYMNSIRDSVHRLITDQIEAMGLSGFYEIQQNSIKGRNGTEFIFEGLRNNATRIKSYEGIDVAWAEEAHSITKTSWDVLIPTIRKPGSEIIVTLNPDLADDNTYQRFVLNPPKEAFVTKINWSDNPWFPEVLKMELEDLKEKDFDAYLNVWEGHPRQILDGAVYANELRKATEFGRIMKVPYDETVAVHTFWDLGWADSTAIWFAQKVGFEYHIIDYLQDSQKSINDYLRLLAAKGYTYGTDWLPHDAKAKSLGTGRSIEEIMRASGRTVRIVPRLSLYDGINAARTVFSNCYFDAEKCADGLHCLRHYRYEIAPGTNYYSKNPVHDWASHGADGFRYLAIAMREKQVRQEQEAKAKKDKPFGFMSGVSSGWMGS